MRPQPQIPCSRCRNSKTLADRCWLTAERSNQPLGVFATLLLPLFQRVSKPGHKNMRPLIPFPFTASQEDILSPLGLRPDTHRNHRTGRRRLHAGHVRTDGATQSTCLKRKSIGGTVLPWKTPIEMQTDRDFRTLGRYHQSCQSGF